MLDEQTRIQEYVQNAFVKNGASLDVDTPLLDEGLIDSMGIFELVGFLEQDFGVTIDDEDIVPENFESVRRMAELVVGKRHD